MYRAFVGMGQWNLRARPDMLYTVKELSRWLQGAREADYVAAKRMVKYLYGTRDTALQLRPRKGTLHLDNASDSGLGRMPDDEEVILRSNGVVEWCTRELTLQDTRTHCLVVTRSRVLRMHSGSCRGKSLFNPSFLTGV